MLLSNPPQLRIIHHRLPCRRSWAGAASRDGEHVLVALVSFFYNESTRGKLR